MQFNFILHQYHSIKILHNFYVLVNKSPSGFFSESFIVLAKGLEILPKKHRLDSVKGFEISGEKEKAHFQFVVSLIFCGKSLRWTTLRAGLATIHPGISVRKFLDILLSGAW